MNYASFSPLHDGFRGFILKLTNKNYTLGIYNLYISAELCCLVMEIPHQLMIRGLMKPTIIGFPLCVKQDEVKKKGDL